MVYLLEKTEESNLETTTVTTRELAMTREMMTTMVTVMYREGNDSGGERVREDGGQVGGGEQAFRTRGKSEFLDARVLVREFCFTQLV